MSSRQGQGQTSGSGPPSRSRSRKPLASAPSADEGFTFQLAPGEDSTEELTLTNILKHHVAFKIRTNARGRYQLSLTQGIIGPKDTCKVAMVMKAAVVDSLLAQGSSLENNDRFVVLMRSIAPEGVEKLSQRSEEERSRILSDYLNINNPRNQSKVKGIKFNKVTFNVKQDQRQITGGGAQEADIFEQSPASKIATEGVVEHAVLPETPAGSAASAPRESAESLQTLPTVTGETKHADGAVDLEKRAGVDGDDDSEATGPGTLSTTDTTPDASARHDAPVLTPAGHATPASPAAVGAAAGTSASTAPVAERAGNSGPAQANEPTIPLTGASPNSGAAKKADVAGDMSKEHIVREMIRLRQKYTSLLKFSTKITTERDKFQKLLLQARSDVLKYRSVANKTRQDVDIASADADKARTMADAETAAAAAAAAAISRSAEQKKGGIPLVMVILIAVAAFLAGRILTPVLEGLTSSG